MLSDKERKLVEPYVTNIDSSVFGFKNLSSEVVGALFGRYSRSELGARELLAREFLSNRSMSARLKNGLGLFFGFGRDLGSKRADEFYAKVLDQFGDDSVAELGQTALAVEGVSNIIAKIIEDRRIGLSPLEKSSRYVRFDRKDGEGKYPYYTDPEILLAGMAGEYEASMNALFDAYSSMIPVLTEHLKKRFPRRPDQSEGAYNAALRAQACDVVRYLLPMSTKTNVGLVGNGRAFEYLVYQLNASGFAEGRMFAALILKELETLLPAFMKRARADKGQKHTEYLAYIRKMVNDNPNFFREVIEKNGLTGHDAAASDEHIEAGIKLINYDPMGEAKVAAAILYDSGDMSMNEAEIFVRQYSGAEQRVISEVLAPRGHRTHKPPRAFEHTEYTFEIVCDIGAFRDLHRHRILTQQRKPYTALNGYSVPRDIIESGLSDQYTMAMDGAAEMYAKIHSAGLKKESQYAVTFGSYIRFIMKMNAREAYHFCELRSTIQGHPSYRFIAQEMARAILRVHPAIGGGMMMTWDGQDELSRIVAEQRREKKERERNKK